MLQVCSVTVLVWEVRHLHTTVFLIIMRHWRHGVAPGVQSDLHVLCTRAPLGT